jgi:hypothetical protein
MKKKMIKNKTFTYPFGQTSKDAAVIQQWMKKENTFFLIQPKTKWTQVVLLGCHCLEIKH